MKNATQTSNKEVAETCHRANNQPKRAALNQNLSQTKAPTHKNFNKTNQADSS